MIRRTQAIRTYRALRTALAVLTMSASALAVASASTTPPQCEGPDVDPWVARTHDRVLRSNGMVRLVVETLGEPVHCDGRVTQVFEGVTYGTLRLDFPEGARFTFETMPYTTSVMELRADGGFVDSEAMVEALRSYVEGRGYRPDWSDPERKSEGEETWETYWDPDPGLNASASLIRVDGVLTGIRVSTAS